jgi:hypothetical protein
MPAFTGHAKLGTAHFAEPVRAGVDLGEDRGGGTFDQRRASATGYLSMTASATPAPARHTTPTPTCWRKRRTAPRYVHNSRAANSRTCSPARSSRAASTLIRPEAPPHSRGPSRQPRAGSAAAASRTPHQCRLLDQNLTNRFRQARNLLKIWPALWTFSEADGVEPTNNRAERGFRGAVIYRKLSLGSQSEAGERTIERLLSASTTCRLQRRSLFAYLTDALTANARGDPLPSLI